VIPGILEEWNDGKMEYWKNGISGMAYH